MDGKALVYDGNNVQPGVHEPCGGFILPNRDTPKEAIVWREYLNPKRIARKIFNPFELQLRPGGGKFFKILYILFYK